LKNICSVYIFKVCASGISILPCFVTLVHVNEEETNKISYILFF